MNPTEAPSLDPSPGIAGISPRTAAQVSSVSPRLLAAGDPRASLTTVDPSQALHVSIRGVQEHGEDLRRPPPRTPPSAAAGPRRRPPRVASPLDLSLGEHQGTLARFQGPKAAPGAGTPSPAFHCRCSAMASLLQRPLAPRCPGLGLQKLRARARTR